MKVPDRIDRFRRCQSVRGYLGQIQETAIFTDRPIRVVAAPSLLGSQSNAEWQFRVGIVEREEREVLPQFRVCPRFQDVIVCER